MPIFQFYCPPCDRREDRILSFSEIHSQLCDACGRKLTWEFVPTRAKARVFANDAKGINPAWTGPAQRRKWLKDRNLVDYDGASADEVQRHHDRQAVELEEKEDREAEKSVHEMLNELGDAGLYTSERPSGDYAEPDVDHTGAGPRDAAEPIL